MVASGLFRGQGWFNRGVLDRPSMGFGAEVESRLTGWIATTVAVESNVFRNRPGRRDRALYRPRPGRRTSRTRAWSGSIARICCYSLRGTPGCHRAACETARSPISDRSPSKWHHSLQCSSRPHQQIPIVRLHYLVCWRQPRRPAPRLSPPIIQGATNIFDFELVFANRHIPEPHSESVLLPADLIGEFGVLSANLSQFAPIRKGRDSTGHLPFAFCRQGRKNLSGE